MKKILLIMLSLFLIAGCSSKKTPEEIIENNFKAYYDINEEYEFLTFAALNYSDDSAIFYSGLSSYDKDHAYDLYYTEPKNTDVRYYIYSGIVEVHASCIYKTNEDKAYSYYNKCSDDDIENAKNIKSSYESLITKLEITSDDIYSFIENGVKEGGN